MEIKYLLKGLIIGFSIAAPVGPIGLLCIKRTLAHGSLAGLATGLGAATADACYGFVAGFGLTFITGFLLEMKTGLHIAGGLFLCILGFKALKKKNAGLNSQDTAFSGYLTSYVSTLFLTLTNPMTIMAFMGIFAGLGIVAAGNGYARSMTLVSGVFLGSALWWLMLSLGTTLAGSRLSKKLEEKINLLVGVILILFGVWNMAGSLM